MGNCLTSCLPESRATKAFRNLNILDSGNNGADFTLLVDNTSTIAEDSKSRSIVSRLFKKQSNKKPVLELVDSLLNTQATTYSRLNQEPSFTGSCTSEGIQLECLDARALLERTITSTPASSLDLEWEHEALEEPILPDLSRCSWINLPENSFCLSNSSPVPSVDPSAVSESDWSRVSSLEWDNIQNPIPPASPPLSEVDADTQFLLSEIERLTNKTLEETGRELFR